MSKTIIYEQPSMNGHKPAEKPEAQGLIANPTDDFDRAYNTHQKITVEAKRAVYIKNPEDLKAIIAARAIGGHALLNAGYGTGKTTLARTLAHISGGVMKRHQGSPDQMASDITGSLRINPATNDFEFRPGSIFCDTFLADELPRNPEKTQYALIEPMEEGQVTVDGTTYKLSDNFMVLATRNDGGKLDGAVADRFSVNVRMPKQDRNDRKLVYAKKQLGYVARQLVTPDEFGQLKAVVSEIAVGDGAQNKANDIIDAVFTNNDYVNSERSSDEGARAFLDILGLAQYAALTRKEREVGASDIVFGASYALPHRVAPHYEAVIDHGMDSHQIVADAIQRVG